MSRRRYELTDHEWEAKALTADVGHGHVLLADRGYDTNNLRGAMAERNAWANIPPKSNRKAALHSLGGCTANAIMLSGSLTVSSSSGASQPDTTSVQKTTSPL